MPGEREARGPQRIVSYPSYPLQKEIADHIRSILRSQTYYNQLHWVVYKIEVKMKLVQVVGIRIPFLMFIQLFIVSELHRQKRTLNHQPSRYRQTMGKSTHVSMYSYEYKHININFLNIITPPQARFTSTQRLLLAPRQ
jgi:hypothetical protein